MRVVRTQDIALSAAGNTDFTPQQWGAWGVCIAPYESTNGGTLTMSILNASAGEQHNLLFMRYGINSDECPLIWLPTIGETFRINKADAQTFRAKLAWLDEPPKASGRVGLINQVNAYGAGATVNLASTDLWAGIRRVDIAWQTTSACDLRVGGRFNAITVATATVLQTAGAAFTARTSVPIPSPSKANIQLVNTDATGGTSTIHVWGVLDP